MDLSSASPVCVSINRAWLLVTALTTLTLHLLVPITDAAYLNSYVRDYQPLWFNHAHLQDKHSRVRREVDDVLRWNFRAYGRNFKLQLQRDTSVFHPEHIIDVGNGVVYPPDTSFLYTGSLSDVPNSKAHMSIHDGHISGQVTVPGDTTYFIESAKFHFNYSTDFHTIIYPESRMDLDPFRHKKKGAGNCGGGLHAHFDTQPGSAATSKRDNPYLKYSAAFNSKKNKAHRRVRRAAGELDSAEAKTCIMHLRADNLLYKFYLSKYNNDAKEAENAILSLFASHMSSLSEIFLDTTFVDTTTSTQFVGINFVLQRSTIMTSCDDVANDYCEDKLDVSNYLSLCSSENHDEFCLVHTFTYRDFSGGTLGLAWVADPNSGNAGFCGKYGRVSTESGVAEQSLNTGIVSFVNYNETVVTRVSQITFAHEVGHNFGSEHDETQACAPYGTSDPDADNGNFIMYAKATTGTLPNNRDFSECSKESIGKVLYSVGNKRENCFTESDEAFCGNKIVEEGEECDCGYESECNDQCCYGRDALESDCKLRSGACSPSEGLCCTVDCEFVEPRNSSSSPCAQATSCTGESYCNGTVAFCPEPEKYNVTQFCNNYQSVCYEGECDGSICLYIDWQECFLTEDEVASEEELCYVACRRDSGSECISSLDTDKVAQNPDFADLLEYIKAQTNTTSDGVERAPGSPCNDYKGYCDTFYKCRDIDSEGPFQQLTNLIFNPVTFSNIEEWIEDQWWAVLLICVGVIVFMGVFVKVFGYNTPSQDPKKPRRGQPPAAARAGRPQQGAAARYPDKRAAPYTTEMAMQDMQMRGGGPGRSSAPHSGAGPYFDNYGYDAREFYQPPPPDYMPPAPPKGSHQFDRIQGQRY